MPTYSYACTECEHHFDTVQSFTDPTLIDCPECQGRLRKLFSSVGIVFKGSGFYRTDSRTSAPGKSGSEPESGSTGKSESGSAGKSEAGSADKSGSGSGARSNSKSGSSSDLKSPTPSGSARAAAS